MLPADVRERVVRSGVRRRHPAGTVLFEAGDAADSVFIVEDGVVRIDRFTPTGNQVLLTLERPGALVGELAMIDGTDRSASCTTVVSSRILSVNAGAWKQLQAAEPTLANWVTLRTVQRLRGLTDQLVAASTLDARGRLAARLCELLELGFVVDRDRTMRLPVSQQDLGRWAGLSREGTVKGLRELRRAGLISTGRQKVTFHRLDELRALAADAASTAVFRELAH